jgi:AcrR family transcriptional regulator
MIQAIVYFIRQVTSGTIQERPMRASEPGTTPRAGDDASPDTRTRLLDAAERLFAERGIRATPLRQITGEAGANLAAVNYHFGSKTELVQEVYARRIRPLNEERLRRLRHVEAAAGKRAPALEPVLHAFLAPMHEMCGSPEAGPFLQLMARANLEPDADIRALVHRQFREAGMQFFAALERALPDLPPAAIFLRFRFLLGSAFFTFAQVMDPKALGLPPHMIPPASVPVLDELVAFLAAGFRADTSMGGRP